MTKDLSIFISLMGNFLNIVERRVAGAKIIKLAPKAGNRVGKLFLRTEKRT
jgi:hypothetical protein